MFHAQAVSPVTMSAAAKVAGGWLLVDYKVVNRGPVPVCTYDGAPGDPASEYPNFADHYGVFVRFRPPDGAEVRRIFGPPPPDKDYKKILIPSVFELKPGAGRAVKFKMPLPLTSKSQFSPPFADMKIEDKPCKSVLIVVGYMTLPPKSKLEPFPENPQAFRVIGTHGPQELATALVPLSLVMKARTDDAFYCP